MSDLAFQDGQTVVFIGDSITDCGRRDNQFPFGNGYVRQAIDLITARYPERSIRYHNKGIGGNTVEDLRNRWHDDVLRIAPDWLTIKIGINDLHRNFGNEDFSPSRYESLYREILDLTKERTSAQVVLIDPFYISTDADSGGGRSRVLAALPGYLDVVERLAEEYGTRHVRTHEAFREQLKYRPADAFCPEPVHPNAGGHMVIAHELLKALDW
jgi:lysophospholipase L1-like esterase